MSGVKCQMFKLSSLLPHSLPEGREEDNLTGFSTLLLRSKAKPSHLSSYLQRE